MKVKKILLPLSLSLAVLGLVSCGATKAVNQNSQVDDSQTGNAGNQGGGDAGNSGDQGGNENQGGQGGNENQGGNTGGETPVNNEPKPAPVINNSKDKVEVTKCDGDQESLYAEFSAVANATSYNAYVKGENLTTYTKVDDQLTRLYKTSSTEGYYRTDVVGLKAGKYSLKIVPVISGTEDNNKANEINNIYVAAYDRTGFAFSKNSNNSTGDASGAYKTDGTLKDGARVLYVSKDNAKTVQLSMNDGKTDVLCTGLQSILDVYEKGKESRPLSIRVIGELKTKDMDGLSSSGEGLQIKGKGAGNNFNLTFEGIGNDAFIHGFGFLVKNATNVEIRNLGVATLIDDDISLDGGNYNIWVHDNDLYYGKNGGGDHAKGDGALDIKGTYYATLSYNHYVDSGKSTLNANNKSGTPDVEYVSYHHNWFDHSDSRHPRIRLSNCIHIYNNYFDGIAKYGVGVTTGSSAFVEANYFRNCKDPMMSSLQGTDAKGDGTFSSETGGSIKAFNNTIIWEGKMASFSNNLVYANAQQGANAANPTSFDAYLASTRDEKMPDTYKTVSGGYTYSNFDTNPDIMYQYNVETPEAARDTTVKYAGRVQGGDLKWEFDNDTEDTNYAVIPGLRNALDTYTSNLFAIQGIGNSSTTPDTPVTPAPTDEAKAEDVVALINALPEASAVTSANANAIKAARDAYNALSDTEKAKVTNLSKLTACEAALAALPQAGEVCTFPYSGSFFTISGKTATDKGSTTYNGKTYSTCLKMETSTSVTFTLTSSATVKIVLAAGSDGKGKSNIKIDGNKITTTDYIITKALDAGEHTISKGDTAYVFYIVVE